MTPDTMLETLKDWLNAAGGLVSQEDIQRIERRLEELEDMLDELESALERR